MKEIRSGKVEKMKTKLEAIKQGKQSGVKMFSVFSYTLTDDYDSKRLWGWAAYCSPLYKYVYYGKSGNEMFGVYRNISDTQTIIGYHHLGGKG